MKKILLCSPYYKDKENTTCGIANWTRNIMSHIKGMQSTSIDLLPYDRSVDLDEESGLWERVKSGVKDYLGIVWKTRKELRDVDYDLIQVSTSASLGLLRDYLILRIARKKGIKIAFHFHFGRMPEILSNNNWESKLMRSILGKCDAAIVMDTKSYNSLTKEGYNNVYYLPNPLSDKILNYVDTNLQSINRINRQILFVGHVVKTKGVFELIEACSQIPDINVRVVGKVFESTKQKLLEIANNRDNAKWLSFVGEIPHEKVLFEMAQCDVFVLPTYSEGFPNVILESMACGCPIVASDVGAIREMLDIDGTPCGVIIRPQNTSEVREAVISLLNDEDKKHLLSERARNRIRKEYCVDRVCSQLETIWQKVLSM